MTFIDQMQWYTLQMPMLMPSPRPCYRPVNTPMIRLKSSLPSFQAPFQRRPKSLLELIGVFVVLSVLSRQQVVSGIVVLRTWIPRRPRVVE